MRQLRIDTAALLALAVAATGTLAPVGTVAAQDETVVAVSWREFQEERWALRDKPAIQAVLEEAGAQYIETDAAGSAEKQIADIEQLINQGADVILILAVDPSAVGPAVNNSINNGVPVIGYDQLIEDPRAFYITFDNVEVGRMQARAIQEVVPEGRYVFIKGNPADPNSDFLHGGQLEVLEEAMDAGKIVNVGEQYTDGWDPSVAQRNMEQILTDNDNNVDAVVASNDGTAGGVVAALASQGLAGEIPVSGQDADNAALNRVALGTQTVTVWKDARQLGAQAARVALQLAENPDLNAVEGSTMFSDGPNGANMVSILLEPTPITKNNLQLVVDAGWIGVDELCAGVESGSVDACP